MAPISLPQSFNQGQVRLERPTRDIHSKLLRTFVNYRRKLFSKIGSHLQNGVESNNYRCICSGASQQKSTGLIVLQVSVVNVIKLFSQLPTTQQNKLACFVPDIFCLVYYLRMTPESTYVERLTHKYQTSLKSSTGTNVPAYLSPSVIQKKVVDTWAEVIYLFYDRNKLECLTRAGLSSLVE